MSVSAAHFKEVTNGYEKRSDGLWVHKGRADIGSARVVNDLQPRTGAGVEFGFVPTGASPYGYIVSYDRDASLYRDLVIDGRNITLRPQGGGTVGFPAGSIGTAALAPGAAQALLGSYFNSAAGSTGGATWQETIVTTTVTTGGGMLRIEVGSTLSNNTAGAYTMFGIGWNGVVQYGMGGVSHAVANQLAPISFVFYVQLTAQTVRFALFFNPQGGVTAISASFNSYLYVTEQKR